MKRRKKWTKLSAANIKGAFKLCLSLSDKTERNVRNAVIFLKLQRFSFAYPLRFRPNMAGSAMMGKGLPHRLRRFPKTILTIQFYCAALMRASFYFARPIIISAHLSWPNILLSRERP